MKTKMIGILAIAGLIAMAVFAGTAAANGVPWIKAHNWDHVYVHEFVTTEDVLADCFFGFRETEGTPARIYVVEYKDTWNVGDELVDVSGGFETVSCNAYGTIYKLVWPKPLDAGKYQLVLDMDKYGSGVYSKIPGYAETVYDPLWTFTVTGEPEPTPTIESSDSSGVKKDTFQPGESVSTIGSGYAASTNYNLYVVDDTAWSDGMAIPSRVAGTVTSVTTDSDGKISPHPTSIWASSVIGEYDIVVD